MGEKKEFGNKSVTRACLRSLCYTNSVPKIQPFWKWLGKQAEVQRRSYIEPGVNFLLGFLIKSCGEMYYLYIFLEGVKGITHFLISNVDSGEPYQWRNCTLTATAVKDDVVVCLPFTEDAWEKPEDPNIILSNVWHYSLGLWVCILQFIKFLYMACVKTHMIYKHALFYFRSLVHFW